MVFAICLCLQIMLVLFSAAFGFFRPCVIMSREYRVQHYLPRLGDENLSLPLPSCLLYLFLITSPIRGRKCAVKPLVIGLHQFKITSPDLGDKNM